MPLASRKNLLRKSRQELHDAHRSLVWHAAMRKADLGTQASAGGNPRARSDYWQRYHGGAIEQHLQDPSGLPNGARDHIESQRDFWQGRAGAPAPQRAGAPKPWANGERRIPGTGAPEERRPKSLSTMRRLRGIADRYVTKIGLPKINHDHPPIAKVDPAFHTEMAHAFEHMKNEPNHPAVKASYGALAKETIAQFEALRRAGVQFKPIPEGHGDPYEGNAGKMLHDLHHNRTLHYFQTAHGYGDEGANVDPENKPLTAIAVGSDGKNLHIDGHSGPLMVNDIFRVVHDVMGHGLAGGAGYKGYSFTPHGEESAWRHHLLMYTPAARMAMTQELRGQNSWVNYGPHGKKNRASPPDTTYADQKVGVWPEKYQELYHDEEKRDG